MIRYVTITTTTDDQSMWYIQSSRLRWPVFSCSWPEPGALRGMVVGGDWSYGGHLLNKGKMGEKLQENDGKMMRKSSN